jgi:hypothetical protein
VALYETKRDSSGAPSISAVSEVVIPNFDQTALLRYDAKGTPVYLQSVGYVLPERLVIDSASTLAAIGHPEIEIGRSYVPWQTTGTPFADIKEVHVALLANPQSSAWDYQSFGVWNGIGDFADGIVGASFGAATPGSAVPTSGTATFSGKLAGLYVSAAGQGSMAAAELNVNANFTTRTLGFASTGTVTSRDFASKTAAPNLNLSGTLTYSPASNTFTGTLTNAGGTMSGASKGQFYGPAAQELGGVFTLKAAAGVETFAGAYGGKR